MSNKEQTLVYFCKALGCEGNILSALSRRCEWELSNSPTLEQITHFMEDILARTSALRTSLINLHSNTHKIEFVFLNETTRREYYWRFDAFPQIYYPKSFIPIPKAFRLRTYTFADGWNVIYFSTAAELQYNLLTFIKTIK